MWWFVIAEASTRADSMIWLWIFLFGACVLYAIWRCFSDRAHHKQRTARLRRRPLLSKGEWLFDQAAALDPYDAWAVAQTLAEPLGCHVTQIYPSDRFDTELLHDKGWRLLDGDVAMDVFSDWFEELCGEFQEDEQFDTVGDVIRRISASRNTARTD